MAAVMPAVAVVVTAVVVVVPAATAGQREREQRRAEDAHEDASGHVGPPDGRRRASDAPSMTVNGAAHAAGTRAPQLHRVFMPGRAKPSRKLAPTHLEEAPGWRHG